MTRNRTAAWACYEMKGVRQAAPHSENIVEKGVMVLYSPRYALSCCAEKCISHIISVDTYFFNPIVELNNK